MEPDDQRDLAHLLSSAIATGLDAHDASEQDRKADELVAVTLSATKKVLRDARAQRLQRATDAVGTYCAKARESALRHLRADERMPHGINYRERYGVLLGMQDTEEVLRRLSQTLDLADEALTGHVDEDAAGAMGDAARRYAARVAKLDGIEVVAADASVADETSVPASVAPQEVSNDDVDAAVEQAFQSVLGDSFDVSDGEAGRTKRSLDRLLLAAESKDRAIDLATHAARTAAYPAAAALAGRQLRIPPAPAFRAGDAARPDVDPAQLAELAALVRASFRTFCEVVRDNGLYAAFVRDSDFGRRGLGAHDIPDVVDRQKDDSVSRSIERIRQANSRHYDGFLDDDFSQHVDAFWYGFKQLMVGVCKLADVDLGPFNAYCNDLAAAVRQAVVDLGAASMDDGQVEAFCDEVDRRRHQEVAR